LVVALENIGLILALADIIKRTTSSNSGGLGSQACEKDVLAGATFSWAFLGLSYGEASESGDGEDSSESHLENLGLLLGIYVIL